MSGGLVVKRALAIALALVNVTCHQVILTAPLDSTMVLIANPTFIAANGGKSVISAVVTESIGTPVPDGTVVQFETTLGRIEPEQGKTNDGIARVNLVADGRSGTATIIAFSGAATATLGGGPTPQPSGSPVPSGGGGVVIGNTNAAGIIVTADPPRLTSSRTTLVTATVVDSAGNPISGVPVFFAVTDSAPLEEFFLGGGTPVFTDNNGRASDTMRTRRDPDLPQKSVTVAATTANGVTQDLAIFVN